MGKEANETRIRNPAELHGRDLQLVDPDERDEVILLHKPPKLPTFNMHTQL